MGLTILYWSLIAVMVVGILGALLPAVPGIGLTVLAILVWGLVTGFSVSVNIALAAAVVALALTTAIDYLAGYLGAKKVGASPWGQIGSVVGMVLGLLGLLPALPVGGPIFGLLIGSMAGAFIGEMLYRRDLGLVERCRLGAKVSLAIVVSSLLGNVVAALLAIVALAVFLFQTWPPPGLAL